MTSRTVMDINARTFTNTRTHTYPTNRTICIINRIIYIYMEVVIDRMVVAYRHRQFRVQCISVQHLKSLAQYWIMYQGNICVSRNVSIINYAEYCLWCMYVIIMGTNQLVLRWWRGRLYVNKNDMQQIMYGPWYSFNDVVFI